MACNNAWANHRLLTACSRLSQEDFVAPRTSFFPSIKATLNHNLTVDWYYVDALERASPRRAAEPRAGRFLRARRAVRYLRGAVRRAARGRSPADRRCAALTDADLPGRSRAAARGHRERDRDAAPRASVPAPDPPPRPGARDARRHRGRAAAARRVLLRERGPPARGELAELGLVGAAVWGEPAAR